MFQFKHNENNTDLILFCIIVFLYQPVEFYMKEHYEIFMVKVAEIT